MAKLKNLLNRIFAFNDFLYILQLEEYKSFSYLKSLSKFYFRRNLQKHDTLKNTKHIKILKTVSIFTYILITLPMWIKLTINNPQFTEIIITMLFTVIATMNIPFIILIANIISKPGYSLLTFINIKKAKNKIKEQDNLYIIGITGSFGKTTTKNFIYQLTQYNYRTQMIPGNINTAIGIANWIQNHLKDNTELLIVEMGAYVKGEIKKSCKITPPDIAVITALGDQHLKRFGGFENLIQAKLEIFRNSKKNSIKLIPQKYYSLISKRERAEIKTIKFNPQQKLTYQKKKIKTNLKSTAAINNLQIALKITEMLNIKYDFVKDTTLKLTLPNRRKQIIKKENFEVIDDSYNISFTTAKNGVEEGLKLAKQKNKNLIVITGGIPELGKKSPEKNKKYGKFLNITVKNIILLKTEFASDIKRGINTSKKLIEVHSMKEAFKVIHKNYNPNDYLILMQPELTDLNY